MSNVAASEYQPPALFAPYTGLINDLDAHEALPVSHWREEFGSAVGEIVEAQMKLVPMEDFAVSLKDQSPQVIRKFLVENAKQIMPNL